MGTVIGGLLMPQFKPYDVGGTLEQAQRIAGSQTTNQTAMLQLADLKAKQQAEQEFWLAIQTNPELAQQLLGGGPVLGSLGPAGAPPGAAPMTQQSVMPGQPPGPAQVVPGGQDLSRSAGVSPQGGGPLPAGVGMPTVTPPQSTLASLGGQPQGQAQPQQNPLLAMAQQNPRAAMMLQQQLEGRQDAAMKRQEQQLSNGVKVAEYVSRMLQGVTDQNSLDQAREQIRLVHPQAAAQVPQMYSKEGVAAVQQRGATITEMALNRYNEAKARNLDMETQMFPELAKRFGMDGEAQTPADGGTTTTTGASARTAPQEYDSAITEANRLYPQVSPTRIKSIIAAESNFDAKAVSSAGAKGPMQLMDATAKEQGVDDPFDIKQNVRGGTRYYAQLLTKYGGDERKALAAYNWGPGNLDKVGGDVSKAPPETQAYVAKVLGGGGGGGAGTGTAQAAATDPRIAQLDKKIAERTQHSQVAALLKNESLSTRLNDEASRLTAEKNRLIEENRHQRERSEEIPRAVQKEREILQAKTDLERQRQEGPLLPKEQRELLLALRTDIRAEPTHKLYQDVRNGYQNVRIGAEADSAQGDLAIINGMAKILDPSGAVMSGEARNVETAQGELERWFMSPQKFFTGDRISTENRPRFLKLAHAMATEKLTTARKELTAVYGPLAKEGNISMEQLLPLEDLKPLGPGPNVDKLDKLISK